MSLEEQIEKLDQEITLNLQKIDSNFSYCFKKITQNIIPHIRNYSNICDDIIDSTYCLTSIFQKTSDISIVEKGKPTDSIFPDETTQDFNVTSTGQILKVPDSSDEETHNNSTIQRQSRKRKVSLLLQQEYGSSSSAMPSPVQLKVTNGNIKTDGINSSPLKEHM
ncbi:hypothetical protein KAFR_0I01620 [Kazachstania africana CBS 2517]|uniref:DASH complex subunit ASK1 n=1 Tax=Kazachstania africana (strain ATCC 22294 / BCRC 22015 / CBS 2517 / CECT 1963 / NBRC 1671 / NRRL Y-8276) TaxID=1071382 RepID=H2AZZ3_KAZAF|nr:hypothetical protein KAFR_0I01620 [Kazachstania africana CBS 2517]CCF59943.1 hypothetical protein KAFR_0I01620 [Kazachstania africana CBS 2517]